MALILRARGIPLAVQAWVDEMAAYVKTRDPNHLVTVGEEGFWAARAYDEAITYDPGNYGGELGWASLTGQNFTAQHITPNIDFCAAHYWPDMWVRSNIQLEGGYI